MILISGVPAVFWGLLLLLILHGQPAASQPPPTFTLQDESGYSLLSQCGKSCLYGSSDVWIGGRLDCTSPYTNDCMCRVDKAPTISSYASECNKNWCTTGGDVQQDINTFLSLYNSYCAKNGYTLTVGAAIAEPTTGPGGGGGGGGGGPTTIIGESTAATLTRVTYATVTAPSSGGTRLARTTGMGRPQTTVDVTVWTTVKPTAPAGAEEGSGGGGGLSTSDKIALGVGIGIGLPATIAAVWVCFCGSIFGR